MKVRDTEGVSGERVERLRQGKARSGYRSIPQAAKSVQFLDVIKDTSMMELLTLILGFLYLVAVM